jgi:hypothetical protein
MGNRTYELYDHQRFMTSRPGASSLRPGSAVSDLGSLLHMKACMVVRAIGGVGIVVHSIPAADEFFVRHLPEQFPRASEP